MTNKAFFVKFNGNGDRAVADQQAVDLKNWLQSTFAPGAYSISEVPPAGIHEVEQTIEAVSEEAIFGEGDGTGETNSCGADASTEKAAA